MKMVKYTVTCTRLAAPLIMSGVVYGYLIQNTCSAADTDNPPVVAFYEDDAPVSTVPFATYNNSYKYHFTLSYPSDWIISTDRDKNVKLHNSDPNELTVQFDYQPPPGTKDYVMLSMPLEIDCDANPQGLTAQQWAANDPQLTVSQGLQKLADGVEAFVATGHAEGDFTAYFVVKGQQVCTLTAFTANAGNQKLISKVVNSFQWK